MKKKLYFLTLFFCYGVAAQTPVLMSDLIGNAYSPNKPMINISGTLYFQANDGVNGAELWKSDGTGPGTVIVKDIVPSSGSSSPEEFARIDNTLYFSAFDPNKGRELWKTTGTALSTVIVKDIAPDFDSSAPRFIKNFNNTLYFAVNNSTELWKSDGTEGGTIPVKTMPASTYILNIVPCGNKLFFTVGTQAGNEQLWKTDGTEGGTIMLKEFFQSTYGHMSFGNTLFFGANDGTTGMELWKSDGTIGGTVLVKDIGNGSFGSFPAYMTSFNGFVYFSAFANLYKTNGTDAGTIIVSGLNGYYMTNVNGTLYFGNYADGYEIYKYNGTTFTKLKYFPRYDNQSINLVFAGLADGTVYFNAKESEHGEELWQTNGTSGGTVLVEDLRPGAYGSFPGNFIIDDGSLIYFTANNGNTGFEIWKKAGNGSITLLKDIEPNSFDANPENLAKLNNLLFLSATDQYNTHLFVVNTSDTYPNLQGISVKNPSNFLAFNNKMYFQGEQSNGRELWVSDGSTATQVKDIYTGAAGGIQNNSNPAELTSVGSNFYFAATNGGDRELWKSDGTELGTVLVKNINTSGNSFPNHLIEFGGNLYFFAILGSSYQLFMSDGSSTGTNAVPYSPTPAVYTINAVDGEIAKTTTRLYVQANTTSAGVELCVLDGTSLTVLKDIHTGSSGGTPNSSYPARLTPINDRLYFTADNGTNGRELWKSDGTSITTELVKDIWPGTGSSSVSNPVKFGNNLFFSANNGFNGAELWKSDGTPDGTIMIKDIVEGSGSSSPSNFCVIGNTLYFSAFHPKFGIELWKTDGTAEGTVLVYDLYEDNDTESNDSNPKELINMGGTLYFAANNGLNGNELFYFKPCPASAVFNQYNYPPNYTYHVTQTIEAYHKITYGKSVNYMAGKSVTLSPGFNVTAQDNVSTRANVFKAEARGCN